MLKPLNPCIRVASPDAVAELQDWLASDDAEAEQLEAVIARRLIGLAREIKPTQALFVRRVGRTCCAALRPLSQSDGDRNEVLAQIRAEMGLGHFEREPNP